MSFDVFFHRFVGGDVVPGGGAEMRAALAPYVVKEDPVNNLLLVEVGDGSADVYLDDEDMMANHITGQDPWELLVQGARAADWVVLPIGSPICLTSPNQRPHLPEELREDAVVVRTGVELTEVIRAS